MLDFTACLAEHLGFQRRVQRGKHSLDELQHGDLRLVREIERLARQLRPGSELLGQHHVGGGSVLDVEVVANEGAVRPNDRTLTSHHGPNRSRHNPIPVEITPTVEVAAPRDDDWRPIRRRIRLTDQITARLADIVGMTPRERRLFGVGQNERISIRLVRRSRDNLLDLRAATTRFEQLPRPANVRLECRQRIAVRDPDDCLSCEVHHRLDLILPERPLETIQVTHVTAHDRYFAEQATPIHLSLRNPVAHETDDISPGTHQPPNQPPSDEARRTRDEDSLIAPEILIDHTVHDTPDRQFADRAAAHAASVCVQYASQQQAKKPLNLPLSRLRPHLKPWHHRIATPGLPRRVTRLPQLL